MDVYLVCNTCSRFDNIATVGSSRGEVPDELVNRVIDMFRL